MTLSLSSKTRRRLEAKRIIFTITPGRSGTGYLSRLLNRLPNVASYHEPNPQFSDIMRQVQENSARAREFLLKDKLPRIASETKPTYIETSHLICKGFVEPLLELEIMSDWISLTRPCREVATSFYKLGTIPGRTTQGLKWVLSPDDPNVQPLPDWQSLHDYQLCYWYCLEVERRRTKYIGEFNELGLRIGQVSLRELKSVKGLNKLIADLDLPKPSPITWGRILYRGMQPVNRKSIPKSMVPKKDISVDLLDTFEQEVTERFQATRKIAQD